MKPTLTGHVKMARMTIFLQYFRMMPLNLSTWSVSITL